MSARTPLRAPSSRSAPAGSVSSPSARTCTARPPCSPASSRRAARTGTAWPSSAPSRRPHPSFQPAVDSLVGQDVEAIVFSEPVENQMDQLRLPQSVTVLTLGPPDVADRENTLAVGLDESGAAFAATDHLLALGHETVWHIAGPADWTSSSRRLAGWRAALQDAGVAEHAPAEGDWSPQSGYEAMRSLLGRPDLTAVFVANDQMAIGAMAAIQQRGLSVPGDVSIVGFDDMPISAYLPTPLTTIRQDFDEATRLAMHRLFRTLDGHPPAERHRMLPGQLITRATSAPPSAERRHLRPAD
ncbi:substrate-binding domain-containing protein [Curtobacterium flaccumfaciens]